MRHYSGLALIAVLLLVIGAAFGPKGAIVDYHRPTRTFEAVPDERHYLRGGSVRIDRRIVSPGTKTVLLQQQYTHPGQPFFFETIRTMDGRLVGASAMDAPASSFRDETLRHLTGRSETRLGERCRVWQVTKQAARGSALVQSGCTTADGLELWLKQPYAEASVATRLRRITVPREAVRLPIEALDTAALMRAGAGTDHQHDHEVALQGPTGIHMLYRRSGNWRYVAENEPGLVNISVHNILNGTTVSYSCGQDGTRHLGWSQPPAYAQGVEPLGTPLPQAPTQNILGERCSMRDMAAGIPDMSRIDCLTTDDVPLLSNRSSGA